MTDFINITEVTDRVDKRTSSLQVTRHGLRVLGNLPHAYTFKPSTAAERDALVAALDAIDYQV